MSTTLFYRSLSFISLYPPSVNWPALTYSMCVTPCYDNNWANYAVKNGRIVYVWYTSYSNFMLFKRTNIGYFAFGQEEKLTMFSSGEMPYTAKLLVSMAAILPKI